MNYYMESDFKNHIQKVSTTIKNQNGMTTLTKFKHCVAKETYQPL